VSSSAEMEPFIIFMLAAFAMILVLIIAFSSHGRGPARVQIPAADGQEPPVLGEKTGSALLSLFQDLYRLEVAAEEDVHRSLPFFATALGLAITALTYVASKLPSWSDILKSCSVDHSVFDWNVVRCAYPADIAVILLLVAAFMIARVLWFLARATKPRGYERVGPERAYINRVVELREYYASLTPPPPDIDAAVISDIRDRLAQDFANILPHNRSMSVIRYNSRARAFRSLLWSLFLVLLATIIIVSAVKSGFLPSNGL
jgi:hypothetical protein